MITELDLRRELEAAQMTARRAMVLLLREGVSVTAFMTSGWPGTGHVATVGRLWHPDPRGEELLILPVWCGPGPLYAPDPILIDLIAFTAKSSAAWYYRVGAPSAVLGEDHLVEAIDSRQPIRLHSDPLAWLQAGCDGAVILEDMERRHVWGRAADDWGAAA